MFVAAAGVVVVADGGRGVVVRGMLLVVGTLFVEVI
jgi:hypothetical protein